MRDMLLFLSAPSVYYRREEEPKDKKCPFCTDIFSATSSREYFAHVPLFVFNWPALMVSKGPLVATMS